MEDDSLFKENKGQGEDRKFPQNITVLKKKLAETEFNGFKDPKGVFIPDEFIDFIMPYLKESELKVMLYIFRRTYGFRKFFDKISINQLINGIKKKDGTQLDNGTRMARNSVLLALRNLEFIGLIKSVKKSGRTSTYILVRETDPEQMNLLEERIKVENQKKLSQPVQILDQCKFCTGSDSAPPPVQILHQSPVQILHPQDTVLQDSVKQDTVLKDTPLPPTDVIAEENPESVKPEPLLTEPSPKKKKSGNGKRPVSLIDKETIHEIFKHWNSLPSVIIHREVEKFEVMLTAKLKSHTKEELMKAMSNYSSVLSDPLCFWKYKWTLDRFLERKSADRFYHPNFHYEDYLLKDQIKDNGLQGTQKKTVDDRNGNIYDLEYIMKKYGCSEKSAHMWARTETEELAREKAGQQAGDQAVPA